MSSEIKEISEIMAHTILVGFLSSDILSGDGF